MDDYDTEWELRVNTTNGTESECLHGYCVSPTLYRKIMGTLLFVVVWPLIVQEIKLFPLGRPAAALLGGTLMVIFNVVPQDQVYHVLGERGNLQAICLLVGMMMLSYYYDHEGLLSVVALWIFSKGKKFRHILWRVCILSAVMSAILTNDATCVVLTPLLLNEHTKQKRSPSEIAPLLLGVATSANIGSASTFFGNPQNAFIASQTDLSLLIFFVTSLPAAVIGIMINTGLLYLVYYKVVVKQTDNSNNLDSGVVSTTNQTHVLAVGNGLTTPHTTSVSMESDSEQKQFPSNPAQSGSTASSSRSVERIRLCDQNQNGQICHRRECLSAESSTSIMSDSIHRHLEGKTSPSSAADNCYGATGSAPKERPSLATRSIKERTLSSKLFILWLGLVTLLLIILLAIPRLNFVSFNLGLVPIGAAVLTMFVDTVLHRQHSSDTMNSVDWTIILMFFGLFVWLAGFENTSLPRRVFKTMNRYMKLSSFAGVLLFTVFVSVGSNVLSNVPLVILIIDELETFACGLEDCSQLAGVLLAWVSTIAGNFTLIGSVANLIVAEKARSSSANYKLTFWEYLKFGVPSTIMVLFTGLPIVYFTSKYVSINIF